MNKKINIQIVKDHALKQRESPTSKVVGYLRMLKTNFLSICLLIANIPSINFRDVHLHPSFIAVP